MCVWVILIWKGQKSNISGSPLHAATEPGYGGSRCAANRKPGDVIRPFLIDFQPFIEHMLRREHHLTVNVSEAWIRLKDCICISVTTPANVHTPFLKSHRRMLMRRTRRPVVKTLLMNLSNHMRGTSHPVEARADILSFFRSLHVCMDQSVYSVP